MKTILKQDLKKYVGKYIYAVQPDGTKVKGKLVALDDERVFIKPLSKNKSKKVETKWLIGLFIAGVVLFGLLAIGIAGSCGRGCCSCCGRRNCCCPPRRCGCERGHHRKHHRKHRRNNRRKFRYA